MLFKQVFGLFLFIFYLQVCDVVLAATDADLVILNSGTFRSDQVHPAGDFTMRDLTNIIPMRDPIVVLKVSGEKNVLIIDQIYETMFCCRPNDFGMFRKWSIDVS